MANGFLANVTAEREERSRKRRVAIVQRRQAKSQTRTPVPADTITDVTGAATEFQGPTTKQILRKIGETTGAIRKLPKSQKATTSQAAAPAEAGSNIKKSTTFPQLGQQGSGQITVSGTGDRVSFVNGRIVHQDKDGNIIDKPTRAFAPAQPRSQASNLQSQLSIQQDGASDAEMQRLVAGGGGNRVVAGGRSARTRQGGGGIASPYGLGGISGTTSGTTERVDLNNIGWKERSKLQVQQLRNTGSLAAQNLVNIGKKELARITQADATQRNRSGEAVNLAQAQLLEEEAKAAPDRRRMRKLKLKIAEELSESGETSPAVSADNILSRMFEGEDSLMVPR